MKLARRNENTLSPVSAFDRLFDDMLSPLSIWREPFGGVGLASSILNDLSFTNKARTPVRKTTLENGALKLEFDVPGLAKEDLQVSYENDIVEVSSTKKEETENKYSSVSYSYRIWAPELDVETIEATCDKGVLTLTANPIKETVPPKKTIMIK